MDIYIVQPGDTIFSIADKYNVPYERLMADNNISPDLSIVNGQIMLITKPERTYTVQPGDTIQSITEAFNIPLLQLLQNNPFLSDRTYLNVGEELIILFKKNEKPIEINAFTFSYVNSNVLKKTLPFLTYLTIIGYRVTIEGTIEAPDDLSTIQLAKEYGVAPIMMLSTLTEQGRGSYGISHKIFNDTNLQTNLIKNLLYILREKGFYGVNFGFQYIIPEDLQNYVNFITIAKDRLASEGYQVFVTLLPNTFGYNPEDASMNPYIAQVGMVADSVILMSYQWTNAYIPSFEQTTIPFIKSYTEYVLTMIPPEKIFLSFTRIAYDWELPYVESESPVTALANFDALRLASQTGAPMGFDEYYITPYFYYEREGIQHFVWFKDARTLNAILELIILYDLKGLSIWNIMDYTPQLWVTLNSQFYTPKVLNVTSPLLT